MKREVKDLVIAWFVLSLAFSIMMSRKDLTNLPNTFLVALISVGLGFVVHELSHRRLARKYGCWAEFRANYPMLLFAVIMSFAGFVFAAPGAVIIRGNVTPEQRGKISFAGPFSNIILAIVFLGLRFFFREGILGLVASYGVWINAFLAVFNLLPFGGFDGSKVMHWNKKYWATALIVGIILMLFVWL